MNKYLVILAGSPRGGERTYSSLYKRVCEYLSADLAICTSIDKVDEEISLFQKADYKWTLDIQDDFFKYYEKNFHGNWKEYFENGKGTGLYESGSIHFVFKDFILKNYLDILLKYEFIIYTRFDQYYIDNHILGNENKILIPAGEDYFGICDRHAVVPNKFISQYLNICNFINSKEALTYKTNYLNCETAYLHHIKHEGLEQSIKRYPRTQFTSALPEDTTNWRIPKYKIYFYKNLMIKYPDEFIDSFKNLTKSQKFLTAFSKDIALYINFIYLGFRRRLGSLKKTIDF